MFGLFNLIYELAELSSQFRNSNIAHNIKLQNSDYYILLLSDYSMHLKTNIKMFYLFFKHLIYFIKKCFLGEHSIDQFQKLALISGICSILFLKLVEIASRSYLKQYHNTSTLVKTISVVATTHHSRTNDLTMSKALQQHYQVKSGRITRELDKEPLLYCSSIYTYVSQSILQQ